MDCPSGRFWVLSLTGGEPFCNLDLRRKWLTADSFTGRSLRWRPPWRLSVRSPSGSVFLSACRLPVDKRVRRDRLGRMACENNRLQEATSRLSSEAGILLLASAGLTCTFNPLFPT